MWLVAIQENKDSHENKMANKSQEKYFIKVNYESEFEEKSENKWNKTVIQVIKINPFKNTNITNILQNQAVNK